MMISHEQALRAAQELLRPPAPHSQTPATHVPSDVVEAAVHCAFQTPEVRTERVRHARHMLDDGLPDSRDIAERILLRALGDAVR